MEVLSNIKGKIPPDGSVTNVKLAPMATKTYKGRTSAATGVPEDVAVAILKADLALVKGDVGLDSVDNTADTAKPVSTAQQTALDLKQSLSAKDATGGYVGLTLFKVNFKNALNTITSFFTNANTVARTYTFQDRDGTIADNTDLALKADKSATLAQFAATTSAQLAGVLSDETGSGAAVFATSPALSSPTVTTQADNNSSTLAASTAFAKSQIATDKNSTGIAQSVNLLAGTAIAGIQVPDNTNVNLGTRDFTIVWKGSLPNWYPTTSQGLMTKWAYPGFCLWVQASTGKIYFQSELHGDMVSTTAPGLVAGTIHHIAVSVSRATSGAMTATFYVDGVQLGNPVVAGTSSTATLVNTAPLYVMGYVGGSSIRYAGTCQSFVILNRAVTAAGILLLSRNGIDFSDKWGSQTPTYSSDFSAGVDGWGSGNGVATGNVDAILGVDNTLSFYANATNGTHYLTKTPSIPMVYGKRYRITGDYYIPSANTNVKQILGQGNGVANSDYTNYFILSTTGAWTSFSQEIQSGGSTALNWLQLTAGGTSTFVGANSPTDDLIYLKNITYTEIGATIALESEGIQADQWYDSSSNALNASYPASGASLTRKYSLVPVQGNLTASRAVNTTYTNASARSLMVAATFRCAVTVAAGNAYVQAKSDTASPPTTIASGKIGIETGVVNEDATFQVVFMVAPGKNYRIDSTLTNGTATLGTWFETLI